VSARWSTIWSRVFPAAFLAVLAAHGLSTSARGEGCHGPERPVLGLSILQDSLGLGPTQPDVSRSDTQLRRLPCSAETPGAPTRVASFPVSAVVVLEGFEAQPTSRPLTVADSTPSTSSHFLRIDRPPRSLSA
jgi:hypothetical protein